MSSSLLRCNFDDPARALARTLVAALAAGTMACGSDGPADDRPPEPASYRALCSDDADCPEGLLCAAPILLKEVCTVPCEGDSDCPDGSECFHQGYCGSLY